MNKKGFSLVELVLALVVGSMVVFGAYKLSLNHLNIFKVSKEQTKSHVSDIVLLKHINRDLYEHGELKVVGNTVKIGDKTYIFNKEETIIGDTVIEKPYDIEGDTELKITTKDNEIYNIVNPY